MGKNERIRQVAIVLSCLLLSGCSQQAALEPAVSPDQEDQPAAIPSESGGEPVSLLPEESNIFYEALNMEEKRIYQSILSGLRLCEASIEIEPPVSEQSFNKIIDILIRQEPDLIHLERTEGIQYYKDGEEVVKFAPSYTMDLSEYQRTMAQINSRIDEVKNQCTGLDAFEAASLINDTLTETCTYNLSAENAHTIQGCLLDGQAVCEGYALAARAFLSACGIENFIVIGEAASSPDDSSLTAHSWNAVKVDENWYYTDFTWNDTDLHPDGLGRHFYFNLPYEKIMENRNDNWTISHMGEYPKENHTEQSWYHRRKMMVESWDEFEQKIAEFAAAQDTPVFSVRFINEELYAQAEEQFGTLLYSGLDDPNVVRWDNCPYLQDARTLSIDWYVDWTNQTD